jgi:TRAP-type transport system periplasmic protein
LPDAEAGKLKTILEPMIDEGIKSVAGTGKPAQAFYDAYVK